MAQLSMSIRSSNSNSKKPLEEKFVHMYKDVFSGCSPIHSKKDSGIQGHAAVTRFWDELLLLKVNEAFLIQSISNLSEAQLKAGTKLVLSELFGTCSLYLDDENFIRVAHSLETLMILFQEIFKKRFNEQGFTMITLIAGSVENAELFFTKLISRVANLLQRDDVPIPVKSLSLRLYFTVLTTTDNINTNVAASYFFQNNIINALLAALSVKLNEDRKSLELDAILVLLLLLLWRESQNIYAETLSSPSTPVLPLLQAAQSLLSYTGSPNFASSSDSSLEIWSMNSVYNFLGNLFGFSSAPANEHQGSPITKALSSQDELWLHTTAGVVLAYFIVYHSPIIKSSQLWPSLNDSSTQGPSSFSQSISSSWIQLLRSFLSVCEKLSDLLLKAEAKEILQAKCCLNLLRCLVESREAVEFLAFCDADDFTFKNSPRRGVSGFSLTIPFRSVLCVILDNAADMLCICPAGSVDPDLFYRAVVLIPIIFNCLKLRGWQLSAQSIGWLRLWNGLMQVCKWAGSTTNYQRPGVAELAELVLGTLESCLGSSQDICSAPEVSECLHAVVMAHMDILEAVLESSTSVPTGTQSGTHLVNITLVRNQYEIQIAALGIRGCPTYEQALRGVQKKGMLSLKLKAKHAGPTHAYTEGTTELRLLINTVRSLVALHRKQTFMKPPRLEVATLGQRPSA